MTPAQILPDLTADELCEVAKWVRDLPLSVIPTGFLCLQSLELSEFLDELADLRRKG